MNQAYKALRWSIQNNPLSLHTFDKKLQVIANTYLPYSVGIEVECQKKPTYEFKDLNKINLLDHHGDSYEQRFRIDSGIDGMVQLYRISQFLQKNCDFNLRSGIHYHVDMTDVWEKLSSNEEWFVKQDWILRALDTWGYKGSYNPRQLRSYKGGWVGIRSGYKTLEFRIGEMAFDYPTLIKRIIHCQKICKKIKIEVMKLKSKPYNTISECDTETVTPADISSALIQVTL